MASLVICAICGKIDNLVADVSHMLLTTYKYTLNLFGQFANNPATYHQ